MVPHRGALPQSAELQRQHFVRIDSSLLAASGHNKFFFAPGTRRLACCPQLLQISKLRRYLLQLPPLGCQTLVSSTVHERSIGSR